MIGKRMSIDPRLYFLNYQGATGLTISLPSTYPKGSFDTTNVKRFNYYFTILAPVSYHLSPKISLGIGPQFMIASGGTDQYRAVNRTDLLTTDNRNFIHKYDAGMVASFTYSRGLKLGLIYYYGLMYVVKDDNNPAKNSSVQLWVGIPFRNRKKRLVPVEGQP
jgi:long-subunit fatty acid transport protein